MGNKTAKLEKQQQEEMKEQAKRASLLPPLPKLKKLPTGLNELFVHEAKYDIDDDSGAVTFWPTPDCEACEDKIAAYRISLVQMLSDENCVQALVYSEPDAQIIQDGDGTCSFLMCALKAWCYHYPFRFKPDHIWLLILQAVAVHVDKNAEKLRDKYVNHEGDKILRVAVSPKPSLEEWQAAIEHFARQIDKYTVEGTGQLLECDFSTTTTVDRICCKVTIMNICQNYFKFLAYTKCGFPQITLDGNKDDWTKLRQKTEQLLQTKVDKKWGADWGKALLPLLDRFIGAFDGKIDCVFWNSMIKQGAMMGSGGYEFYSGWINVLFPYLKEKDNEYCIPYTPERSYVRQTKFHKRYPFGSEAQGGDIHDYPSGMASAPVTWNKHGKDIPLRFLGGFIGYSQDEDTMEICPYVGWCIAESMTEKQIKKKKEKEAKENQSSW